MSAVVPVRQRGQNAPVGRIAPERLRERDGRVERVREPLLSRSQSGGGRGQSSTLGPSSIKHGKGRPVTHGRRDRSAEHERFRRMRLVQRRRRSARRRRRCHGHRRRCRRRLERRRRPRRAPLPLPRPVRAGAHAVRPAMPPLRVPWRRGRDRRSGRLGRPRADDPQAQLDETGDERRGRVFFTLLGRFARLVHPLEPRDDRGLVRGVHLGPDL